MKLLSPFTRMPVRETLRRIDRIAADLNVLLVVIAIGLATLDMTFFVTLKVVDSLPQVTRVTFETAPPTPATAPEQAPSK